MGKKWNAEQKAAKQKQQQALMARVLNGIPSGGADVVPEMSLLTLEEAEAEPPETELTEISVQTLIDGTDTKALRQVVKEVKQASADDEKEKAERKKRLKSQMSTLMAPVSLGFEEDDISQKADKEDKPKNPASADKKPKP